MGTTQDAALRYQSQAVQTAPGPQLLVMLFDRMAADIEIADRALEDGDLLRHERAAAACPTGRPRPAPQPAA